MGYPESIKQIAEKYGEKARSSCAHSFGVFDFA
jgi:hypothetical protein